MRVAVPCFGQLWLHSLATGASLGFLLACGSSGAGNLFGAGAGGPSSNGGAPNTGGAAVLSGSGGSAPTLGGATSGGGDSATGGTNGTALGGSAVGGSNSAGAATTGGGGAASGGATPGGASSGGAAHTGGQGGSTAGALATGGASTGGLDGIGGAGGDSGGSGGGGCSVDAVERCDGLDNDCDAAIDEQACPDDCTGFALSGHGYMVCDVEVNASKASALCEDQGLRLAWIESDDENAGLLAAIEEIGGSGRGGAIPEVSIGATDAEEEGTWHWLGGADFWLAAGKAGKGAPVDGAYTNWAEGRPNNSDAERLAGEDCAVLVIDRPDDGEPGQWNDVECELDYGVLCEEP